MGKKRPQQMTWSDPFVWKMAPPKQSLDEGAKQDWTRGPEYWLGPDVWAPIEAKLIELGSDCPAELMYDLHYALSTVMQKYYQGLLQVKTINFKFNSAFNADTESYTAISNK
jgi:hypothetical protein